MLQLVIIAEANAGRFQVELTCVDGKVLPRTHHSIMMMMIIGVIVMMMAVVMVGDRGARRN